MQLLRTIHSQLFEFWVPWVFMTGAIAIGSAWITGRSPLQEPPVSLERGVRRIKDRRLSMGTGIVLGLLAALMMGYVLINIKGEAFTYFDDSFFTRYTLQGWNFPPPIWVNLGRFWPLGEQEFNLIRHVTRSAAGYHLLLIGQLVLFVCGLVIVDGELKIRVRLAFATFLLTLPSVVDSFYNLVIPERDVLLWLLCLVYSLRRFEEARLTRWAVAAVVSAQVMVYYKETAFLLILSVAIMRLILRCRQADHPGWSFNRLRESESRLDLCLITVALSFVCFYLAVVFPHFNMGYRDLRGLPRKQVLIYYTRFGLPAWLLISFAARRIYLILQRSITPSRLWDSLAIGAVVYFGAFLYLGLVGSYYLAPVDMIAVLYIGRYAVMAWRSKPRWQMTVACFMACAVASQGIGRSLYGVYFRKNVVLAKAEIANVVLARNQAHKQKPTNLFFPFANAHVIEEFVSYLTYRRIEAHGTALGSALPQTLVISGRSFSTSGPCEEDRNYTCYHAVEPEPGDLVIEFPEDLMPIADRLRYQKGGEFLFAYEPSPRVPKWLEPVVNHLSLAMYLIGPRESPPSGWLHASVTEWK